MMNTLHFLFPAMNPSESYHWAEFPLPHTPILKQWRQFSRIRNSQPLVAQTFTGSLKSKILANLNLPPDTPSFLACPIAGQMDLHSMGLCYGSDLALGVSEAHQLADKINDFLHPEGWQCHIFHPHWWLITTDQFYDWDAPDIWSLDNRIDSTHQITGSDAAVMRRILTELQMLLFAQQTCVNSLWIWQDTMGVGQADGLIGPVHWLPVDSSVLLQTSYSWHDICQFSSKKQKVVLYDNGASLAFQNGWMSFCDFWEQWDANIARPINEALLSGNIERLIISGNRYTWTVTPYNSYCFWRQLRANRSIFS